MSDVLSREDEDSEGQAPQVVTTTDGSLRMKKGKVKGELPRTPEDLRTKIRLMAVHWELVKLKFPNHVVVRGLSDQVWQDYVE